MKFTPKIAHEYPKHMLNLVNQFTDYDYALVHLLIKDPEYKQYMLDRKAEGRKIILDNSLYELGKAFDPELYMEQIRILEPSEVILPDCLNDSLNNFIGIEKFLSKYSKELADRNIGVLAVVQGSDDLLSDYGMITCLLEIHKHVEGRIAIPFGSSYFEKSPAFSCNYYRDKLSEYEKKRYDRDILFKKAFNRFAFMDILMQTEGCKHDIHLLGNYCPAEYRFYKESSTDFSHITSIDTSHPVALAMEETTYDDAGIYYKPSVKIDEIYENKLTKGQEAFILYNIKTFRELC